MCVTIVSHISELGTTHEQLSTHSNRERKVSQKQQQIKMVQATSIKIMPSEIIQYNKSMNINETAFKKDTCWTALCVTVLGDCESLSSVRTC